MKMQNELHMYLQHLPQTKQDGVHKRKLFITQL